MNMDPRAYDYHEPRNPLEAMWRGAVRWTARVGIAFGVSSAAAIAIGAALTNNALAQIAVTIFAAFGLWFPVLLIVAKIDRWRERRAVNRGQQPVAPMPVTPVKASWQRLTAIAPDQADRLSALRNSLDNSHKALSAARLDPDAHDLCLLIDKRLPDLIDRELDSLPPDDVHRKRQVGGLVDLIEQFARHCSRSRDNQSDGAEYEAEVLRRRFQQRLSGL